MRARYRSLGRQEGRPSAGMFERAVALAALEPDVVIGFSERMSGGSVVSTANFRPTRRKGRRGLVPLRNVRCWW